MELTHLLAETGQSQEVLIWTLILTSAGSFVTALFALVKGQLDRWQDRQDAKAKAAAILAEMTSQETRAKEAAAEREKRIRADIEVNTEVNKEQIRVSNGHNEKIKEAMEKVADVTKAFAEATPKEVHVTVDGLS